MGIPTPKWDFHYQAGGKDDFTVKLDFAKLMSDMTARMMEIERNGELHVVVEWLRAQGFYVLDQRGVLDKGK